MALRRFAKPLLGLLLMISGPGEAATSEPPQSAATPRADVQLAVQAPPDTLIYETTSWGRVTYHVEVHRDGRLRAWRSDFSTGERLEERDEHHGPGFYEQVVATIEPLSLSSALDCSGAPTDAPSGYYRWRSSAGPQTFDVYYGCYAFEPQPEINGAVAAIEGAFFALIRPPAGTAP